MTNKSLSELFRRAHAERAEQPLSENQIDRILALSNNLVSEADVDAEIAHALSSPQHITALKLALQSRIAANELANSMARLARGCETKQQIVRESTSAHIEIKTNRFRLAWALPAIALALVLGFMHKPMSPAIQSVQIEAKPDIIGVMASSFEESAAPAAMHTSAVQSDTVFVGDFDS